MTFLEVFLVGCSVAVLFMGTIFIASWHNIREQGFTWREWDRIQQARREYEHEKAMQWVEAWEERKVQEAKK